MIRGAILIALVGIIVFIVLYERPIDVQKEEPRLYIAHSGETLGEAIKRDTDNDGVPDWEEKLLNLDPNNPRTLQTGEDDAIVAERLREERRIEVKLSELTTDSDIVNETDTLTRDLYVAVASLSQEGELNQTVTDNFTALTSAHLATIGTIDPFSKEELTIIENTQSNNESYFLAYSEIISSYKPTVHPVAIMNKLEEEETAEVLRQLETPLTEHRKLLQDLLALSVPEDASIYHLSVVNSLRNVITSIENMQYYFNDPIRAMSGTFSYYDHMADFGNAVEVMYNEYYQKELL